jgi:nitrite reductase/ring-hydroxylating ferredoxin subunit
MSSNLTETIEKVLSDESEVREATWSHQTEFPYERDEEAQVTRREFCNFLFLTSSALFVSAAGFAGKYAYDAQFTRQYAPMKIEGAGELAPGSALNFFYPDENDTAILIRTTDGEYHAYGQKCTHLACPVYYEKRRGRIECPCHEAGFDAKTGAVLYGPPPRPLDRIEIEVRDGGEIWAVGRTAGGGELHG